MDKDTLREQMKATFGCGDDEAERLVERLLMAPEGCPGNAARYDVATVEVDPTSRLSGKTVVFLGSSVTEGACSLHQSFVEFLVARDGVVAVKEAVSGTTLANDAHDGSSYVERLRAIDRSLRPDAFVCQLSTNDATKGKELGQLADEPFYDTATVAGALQDVVAYVRDTWGCPIAFYTGTYFASEEYAQMRDLLLELSARTGVAVIDLYRDLPLEEVGQDDYWLYMHDPIHPTKAGYRLWWLPVFENELTRLCELEDGLERGPADDPLS